MDAEDKQSILSSQILSKLSTYTYFHYIIDDMISFINLLLVSLDINIKVSQSYYDYYIDVISKIIKNIILIIKYNNNNFINIKTNISINLNIGTNVLLIYLKDMFDNFIQLNNSIINKSINIDELKKNLFVIQLMKIKDYILIDYNKTPAQPVQCTPAQPVQCVTEDNDRKLLEYLLNFNNTLQESFTTDLHKINTLISKAIPSDASSTAQVTATAQVAASAPVAATAQVTASAPVTATAQGFAPAPSFALAQGFALAPGIAPAPGFTPAPGFALAPGPAIGAFGILPQDAAPVSYNKGFGNIPGPIGNFGAFKLFMDDTD